MREKHRLYSTIADALEQTEDESMGDACRRILATRGHPCWAAARCILDAGDLRGDAAWEALRRARLLLPDARLS